jgi:hypothetical protein
LLWKEVLSVSEQNYIYDPEEQTMVFSVDTTRHVRVAFSEGQVWYAIHDIAKLLRYRAPGKAAKHKDYDVKLLRVPHTSQYVRGFTNCNCITKEALKRFLKIQNGDEEICRWILTVVIPQAERQFASAQKDQSIPQFETYQEIQPILQIEATPTRTPESAKMATILAALDKIITEAVLLKRELQ